MNDDPGLSIQRAALAISDGSAQRPMGIGISRINGPISGSSSVTFVSGVSVLPGASELRRTPSAAHDPGVPADRAALVASQARLDQSAVDRRHRCRAGAHGDGSRRATKGEGSPEPIQHRDGTEVADRHEQLRWNGHRRHPREAREPVEHVVARVEHARESVRPAFSGAEVGGHLGVPQVDPDHALAIGLEQLPRGGADARRRTGQRNPRHRSPESGGSR